MMMPLAAITVWRCVILLYVLLVIGIIAMLIHEKRDPTKALAWILLIALVPVVGIVVYMVFGRNYRKRKMFSRKGLTDLEHLEKLSEQQFDLLKSTDDEALPNGLRENCDMISLLLNNNKSLLTIHNRVRVLNNGKETFPAIFDALREAKESIHLEYYIFENDRLGERVGKILMEKAQKGIEVRLIYDDVGSWSLTQGYVRKLRAAGVKVGCFMPVAFPWLTSTVNYRNHRKIIVVDGRVGFTGGINIAERYLRGNRLGRWRDTHLKIEGEAVSMLQGIFIMDWYFVTGEVMDYRKYLPENTITELSPLQIASSGPDSDWASIMQAFFLAITKAQKHIYISTPYFLPNQAIMTALKVAALSGVDVRVMIPSRSD
ncbi:MAG: cardiolipin synthase, partial [Rikenellaceae bacterium]|nr:cardiolipin synthase [Rikenellaceae bacterium]